jgi:Uncharacterized conserved protein (COG2071)
VLPGLDTMVRQARSLDETVHRPWPVPERTWLLAQSSEHLLFAHWALPRRRVEPLLPERLQLDTFDGQQRAGGEVDAERQLPPELTLPRKQPLLHYARRLDVLVWKPRRANAAD